MPVPVVAQRLHACANYESAEVILSEILSDASHPFAPVLEWSVMLIPPTALRNKYRTESPICGRKLDPRTVSYSCRTCNIDERAILCKDCWEPAKHVGHDFVITRSSGLCDCADVTAIKPSAFCSRHDGSAVVPIVRMEERARVVLGYIARYILSWTTSDLHRAARALSWLSDLCKCGAEFRNVCVEQVSDAQLRKWILEIPDPAAGTRGEASGMTERDHEHDLEVVSDTRGEGEDVHEGDDDNADEDGQEDVFMDALDFAEDDDDEDDEEDDDEDTFSSTSGLTSQVDFIFSLVSDRPFRTRFATVFAHCYPELINRCLAGSCNPETGFLQTSVQFFSAPDLYPDYAQVAQSLLETEPPTVPSSRTAVRSFLLTHFLFDLSYFSHSREFFTALFSETNFPILCDRLLLFSAIDDADPVASLADSALQALKTIPSHVPAIIVAKASSFYASTAVGDLLPLHSVYGVLRCSLSSVPDAFLMPIVSWFASHKRRLRGFGEALEMPFLARYTLSLVQCIPLSASHIFYALSKGPTGAPTTFLEALYVLGARLTHHQDGHMKDNDYMSSAIVHFMVLRNKTEMKHSELMRVFLQQKHIPQDVLEKVCTFDAKRKVFVVKREFLDGTVALNPFFFPFVSYYNEQALRTVVTHGLRDVFDKTAVPTEDISWLEDVLAHNGSRDDPRVALVCDTISSLLFGPRAQDAGASSQPSVSSTEGAVDEEEAARKKRELANKRREAALQKIAEQQEKWLAEDTSEEAGQEVDAQSCSSCVVCHQPVTDGSRIGLCIPSPLVQACDAPFPYQYTSCSHPLHPECRSQIQDLVEDALEMDDGPLILAPNMFSCPMCRRVSNTVVGTRTIQNLPLEPQLLRHWQNVLDAEIGSQPSDFWSRMSMTLPYAGVLAFHVHLLQVQLCDSYAIESARQLAAGLQDRWNQYAFGCTIEVPVGWQTQVQSMWAKLRISLGLLPARRDVQEADAAEDIDMHSAFRNVEIDLLMHIMHMLVSQTTDLGLVRALFDHHATHASVAEHAIQPYDDPHYTLLRECAPDDFVEAESLDRQSSSSRSPSRSSCSGRARAVCLLCGCIVCLGGVCCRKSISDASATPPGVRLTSAQQLSVCAALYSSVTGDQWLADSIGDGRAHAERCHAGHGLYLMLRAPRVVLLRPDAGGYIKSIYVDRHGEEDESFRRGLPLHLLHERFHEYERLFLAGRLGYQPQYAEPVRNILSSAF